MLEFIPSVNDVTRSFSNFCENLPSGSDLLNKIPSLNDLQVGGQNLFNHLSSTTADDLKGWVNQTYETASPYASAMAFPLAATLGMPAGKIQSTARVISVLSLGASAVVSAAHMCQNKEFTHQNILLTGVFSVMAATAYFNKKVPEQKKQDALVAELKEKINADQAVPSRLTTIWRSISYKLPSLPHPIDWASRKYAEWKKSAVVQVQDGAEHTVAEASGRFRSVRTKVNDVYTKASESTRRATQYALEKIRFRQRPGTPVDTTTQKPVTKSPSQTNLADASQATGNETDDFVVTGPSELELAISALEQAEKSLEDLKGATAVQLAEAKLKIENKKLALAQLKLEQAQNTLITEKDESSEAYKKEQRRLSKLIKENIGKVDVAKKAVEDAEKALQKASRGYCSIQ